MIVFEYLYKMMSIFGPLMDECALSSDMNDWHIDDMDADDLDESGDDDDVRFLNESDICS